MLKRLSEQADPNDPQASVSFGGFKKAIHKPVLYKGRYQIRLQVSPLRELPAGAAAGAVAPEAVAAVPAGLTEAVPTTPPLP